MTSPLRVVLGPQRDVPLVREALEAALPGRMRSSPPPVAAVTAGWEEREAEVDELRQHVRVPVVNLALYERAERAFAKDPELFAAMRARHDRLRRLQEVYRLRLAHALAAARELLERRRTNGDREGLLEPELASAVEAVRTLDAHHVGRIREVHAEFLEEVRPRERPALERVRDAVLADLEPCEAVCLAGGHVAILLNRLRLFDLREQLESRPLVAWSAGAMAVAERVVVFHDSPPQGAGDAEVLEVGLGLLPGVVPLPHASRRLRLDDVDRVELFARRFGPAASLALDPGARADWDGTRWHVHPGTPHLSETGELVDGSLPLEPAGPLGPAGAGSTL